MFDGWNPTHLVMTGGWCVAFVFELRIGAQQQEALGGHKLPRDHCGLRSRSQKFVEHVENPWRFQEV